MHTSLSVALVEQYESMMFHLYGGSFIKSLGYLIWLHIKNSVLMVLFCFPLYGLLYTGDFFTHSSLTLKIISFGTITILSLGYFVLIPWWIHCKISKTHGILSIFYQLFVLIAIDIMCIIPYLGITYTGIVIGGPQYLNHCRFLGLDCMGVVFSGLLAFLIYICFLQYKSMLCIGRMITPDTLRATLVRTLEEIRDKALNRSWPKCFFYIFSIWLKNIVFFMSYAWIHVVLMFWLLLALGVRTVQWRDKFFAVSLVYSILFLPFLIAPRIIQRRYVAGMWAFLHTWGCVGMIMGCSSYILFFYIMAVKCMGGRYFSVFTPLGAIMLGLGGVLSYGVLQVYRKIFFPS